MTYKFCKRCIFLNLSDLKFFYIRCFRNEHVRDYNTSVQRGMRIVNLAHGQDLGNTYVNCVYVRCLTDCMNHDILGSLWGRLSLTLAIFPCLCLLCQRTNVYLVYVYTILPNLEFGIPINRMSNTRAVRSIVLAAAAA